MKEYNYYDLLVFSFIKKNILSFQKIKRPMNSKNTV